VFQSSNLHPNYILNILNPLSSHPATRGNEPQYKKVISNRTIIAIKKKVKSNRVFQPEEILSKLMKSMPRLARKNWSVISTRELSTQKSICRIISLKIQKKLTKTAYQTASYYNREITVAIVAELYSYFLRCPTLT